MGDDKDRTQLVKIISALLCLCMQCGQTPKKTLFSLLFSAHARKHTCTQTHTQTDTLNDYRELSNKEWVLYYFF